MTKHDIEGNGWNEYEKLVLHQLRELNEKADTNLEEHKEIVKDIAALKVRAGITGFLGGLLPVVIGLGIWLLKSL